MFPSTRKAIHNHRRLLISSFLTNSWRSKQKRWPFELHAIFIPKQAEEQCAFCFSIRLKISSSVLVWLRHWSSHLYSISLYLSNQCLRWKQAKHVPAVQSHSPALEWVCHLKTWVAYNKLVGKILDFHMPHIRLFSVVPTEIRKPNEIFSNVFAKSKTTLWK